MGSQRAMAPAGAARKSEAPAQALQHLLRVGAIRAKLTVSQPGDPLEQEADRVAEEVMRMPAPSTATSGIQRKCSCSAGRGHVCDECSKKEEQKIQTKEAPGRTPSLSPQAKAHVEPLRSGGQPLPGYVRSFFEPRFGRDFSGVRVHSDSWANEAVSALQARAFTLGKDIVFGAGQYAPESSEGKRLLAHELAHVGQQGPDGRVHRQVAAQQPAPPSNLHSMPAKQKREPALDRQPAFEGCSQYQRCMAVERLPAARSLVDAALGIVEPIARGNVTSEANVNLLRKHFHTSSQPHASTIQSRFTAIRNELGGPVRFGCHAQEPATCQGQGDGIVGAFTGCGAGDKVDLCTNYYPLSCGAQARILVHEIAHHVPGLCKDQAYAYEPAYQNLSPEAALGNADSYAQLAFEAFPGSPTCADCSQEIGLRNRKF